MPTTGQKQAHDSFVFVLAIPKPQANESPSRLSALARCHPTISICHGHPPRLSLFYLTLAYTLEP